MHADLAATRSRWLGYMFAVAALLSPATLLVPHAPGYSAPGLVVVTVLAAIVALTLLPGRVRLSDLAVHGVVALGAILTAAVIHFTDGLPNAATLFFVWVVLFAFYFFGLAAALAHLAFVLVLYVLSALWTDAPYPLAAHSIATAGTLVGSGVIVASLKRRIETLMRALSESALTDELTGLPNRRAFNEDLSRALARSARTAEPLALATLDLDRFKEVNDEFGHPVGDQVLRELAAVLRASIRAGDSVARVGGEEFAIVFPGADAAAAMELAERVRQSIAEAFADADASVTASIGVASPAPGEDADGIALLRRADHALYEAKRQGRDCVVGQAEEPRVASSANGGPH